MVHNVSLNPRLLLEGNLPCTKLSTSGYRWLNTRLHTQPPTARKIIFTRLLDTGGACKDLSPDKRVVVLAKIDKMGCIYLHLDSLSLFTLLKIYKLLAATPSDLRRSSETELQAIAQLDSSFETLSDSVKDAFVVKAFLQDDDGKELALLARKYPKCLSDDREQLLQVLARVAQTVALGLSLLNFFLHLDYIDLSLMNRVLLTIIDSGDSVAEMRLYQLLTRIEIAFDTQDMLMKPPNDAEEAKNLFDCICDIKPICSRIFSSCLLVLLKAREYLFIDEFLRDAEGAYDYEFWACIANTAGLVVDEDFTILARTALDRLNESDVHDPNYTPDQDTLLYCACYSGNIAIIGLLVENGAGLSKEHKQIIAAYLMETGRLDILELLINANIFSEPLLLLAVSVGDLAPVQFLQAKEPSSDTVPAAQAFAAKRGCVTLLKALGGQPAFDEYVRSLLLRPDALFNNLLKIYLNSDLADTVEVLEKLDNEMDKAAKPSEKKTVLKMRQFLRGPGKVMARFPSQASQEIMFEKYGRPRGHQNYIEQQRNYSIEESQKLKRLIQHIQEDDASLYSAYELLGTAIDSDAKKILPSFTPLLDYYSRFRGLQTEMLIEALDGARDLKVISSMENTYQVLHTLRDGTGVELTKVCLHRVDRLNEQYWLTPRFLHNTNGCSPRLLEELSKVFQLLKNPQSRLSQEELRENLCYFYWLSAHAMPILRKNSQQILLMHLALAAINSREIGPPARFWVLVDCVALSMPYRKFRDRFYGDLFQPMNLSQFG